MLVVPERMRPSRTRPLKKSHKAIATTKEPRIVTMAIAVVGLVLGCAALSTDRRAPIAGPTETDATNLDKGSAPAR